MVIRTIGAILLFACASMGAIGIVGILISFFTTAVEKSQKKK